MIFSSRNFYLSTFMLVMIVLLVDIGFGKILMGFGYVLDPLEINVEEYGVDKRKNVEMKFLDEKVVKNDYTGDAFSQEPGQAPQILSSLNLDLIYQGFSM